MAGSAAERGVRSARPASRRPTLAWLGVAPFFIFATLFMFLPASFLVVGSFLDQQGQPTLQNYVDLTTPFVATSYANSIEISAVTAIGGGIFGFLLAAAVILGGLPRFMRNALMTFSGVASNFAGVPLALAFIYTLGNLGFLTALINRTFATDIGQAGFSLYSKVGLEIVYMYFQFPLMVLIIAPALDGLKRDWREAAENMGATGFQYWRYVAFPILLPSLMGAVILLFGNAFGAQATAFQLTGGTIPIASIVIGAQIRGDVLHNTGLGFAMAMGMVFIMGAAITGYSLLQRRSERWLK